jgi:hypothetical protein
MVNQVVAEMQTVYFGNDKLISMGMVVQKLCVQRRCESFRFISPVAYVELILMGLFENKKAAILVPENMGSGLNTVRLAVFLRGKYASKYGVTVNT